MLENNPILIHGDCLEVMSQIPDKSVDMILADLPYGTTACKWDVVIPFEPLWMQYKRIIKDKRAIVLFGKEPFSSHLRISNLGWYKYDWTWNKSSNAGFLNAKTKPMNTTENILVFSEGKTSAGNKNNMSYFPQGLLHFNKITRNGSRPEKEASIHRKKSLPGAHGGYLQQFTNWPKDYLEFSYVKGKEAIHPTQKPVPLLEYLIKTYTQEDETVLDNVMGSGSTGVACKNLNRNFIGIEKDERYFDIAKERILGS